MTTTKTPDRPERPEPPSPDAPTPTTTQNTYGVYGYTVYLSGNESPLGITVHVVATSPDDASQAINAAFGDQVINIVGGSTIFDGVYVSSSVIPGGGGKKGFVSTQKKH